MPVSPVRLNHAVLFGVGASAPPKRRGGIGLSHLARQVDTIDELEQARPTLVKAGAAPVTQGPA